METKIEQTEILAELMTLEIMGVIKSIAGGRYKKILYLCTQKKLC